MAQDREHMDEGTPEALAYAREAEREARAYFRERAAARRGREVRRAVRYARVVRILSERGAL